MAFDPIRIGTSADDGTGDRPRTAGARINANFAAISGSTGATLVGTNNGTVQDPHQQ